MTEPGTPSPILPWEAPPEAPGPAPGIEFAGHGPRLVAYIIDALILTVVALVAVVLLTIVLGLIGGLDREGPRDPALFAIVIIVWVTLLTIVTLGYFPYFWQRSGQTPGMRPFDLRVVRDRDGTAFGWSTALLRVLGLYVSSLVFYLGFIWIFIDKRRRGWHDLIAGTVVVKRS